MKNVKEGKSEEENKSKEECKIFVFNGGKIATKIVLEEVKT